MKKAINIIFTVLATLAVLNCGGTVEVPEIPEEKPENPTPGTEPEEDEGFGGDVTFTATIESLSDGSQPSWKKGETISVFDGESVAKATNTADDGPVAKFPATIKKKTEAIFALSPSVEGIRPTTTSVNLEIPATQTVGSEPVNYRVAKGKSDLLYFRNLVAKVQFTIGMENVTSVLFKPAGDVKLAGSINVDYSGENPVVSASVSNVELKGEFKKGDTYQIVLAPADLSGFTVEIYNGDKVVGHVDGAQTTLAPGATLNLSEIKEDNPVYQITHMWLFGGTMPEWSCTAVFDMFSKAEQFNNEDGRGLNALKDNYLVFNSDGTFRNWAGEDQRNWWFVYDGAYNSEGGVDVDLKQFYDVLPRSTATYTIDAENKVIFTMPDGSTRNATLVPAGNYLMPQTTENGGSGQYVTITEQALLFEITGGRDVYNNDIIYKDYWRICAHPRALFIEIKKVDEGFVIPASVCTTDEDFEYIPPTYDFDWSTLPGVWNLYGENKTGTTDANKSYGLWVNGGSGNDPAFISPINKSWCWNDSLLSEIDNTLTISITGMSGSAAIGTIKWEAGPDGGFWDCIWKSTGADLSNYFSPLPKGQSTVQVDLTTQEIVIGDNLKPRFLLPGVHTFTCDKRLEIPSNCFGLGFHIMDAVPVNESAHWTDVDRFVNAPLDYVMIFQKK